MISDLFKLSNFLGVFSLACLCIDGLSANGVENGVGFVDSG